MMKKLLSTLIASIAGCILLMPMALAQTPDGETPAEETVCQDESGALKGLCNAYCEAMDCNLNEAIHASPKACARVLDNYFKKSGGANPPCLNSGCAATATDAANDYYAECITDSNNNCKTASICADKAKRIFNAVFKKCRRECSLSCGAEFQSCATTAKAVRESCLADAQSTDDKMACENAYNEQYRACKIANNECTKACVGPIDPYVPPACPAP